MSSGMFRVKESSNRIELSLLVQDLLNFGVFGSLRLWGGGGWWGGIWGHGGSPHTHAHACTHTCTQAHLYMYRNCKWLPTWRHPCLACLACLTCMYVHACMCVCVCVCVCVCMHAWDIPPHTHTPHSLIPTPTPSTHLSPPRGWTPGIT